MMGLIVAVGSLVYIGLTVALSLGYVAPAASLANAWDTKLGGALADAVSCNAVVKAFGAEAREDARFAKVVAKWRGRTRRTWVRGTHQRHDAGRDAAGAARRRSSALRCCCGRAGRRAPATSPSC